MQDPIGNFLRIRDFYLSYLDTAFRISDESVSLERKRLLKQPGTLCTEPLVEPLPRYEQASHELHELVDLPESLNPIGHLEREARLAFVELVLSGLFDSRPVGEARESIPTTRVGTYRPYEHQMQMLSRGSRTGKPGIVTSGTGSGKTESFLLPILASLANEARQWPKPGVSYLQGRWWRKERHRYSSKTRPFEDPWQSHREGESPERPKAMRAMILYPMNALVEDQLVRLRKALDSFEARSAMDRFFDGNRIFFGRYTSKTPATGHRVHPGLRDLLSIPHDSAALQETIYAPEHSRAGPDGMVSLSTIRQREIDRRSRKQHELVRALQEMDSTQGEARRAANGNPKQAASASSGEEAPFLFPSVDGNELVTRQDIQATPPDILITNTSMLSAMLGREVDALIFDETRDWLQRDPNAYFYLVLDELHLQRGSAGTEVAYLLRQLLHRLGLSRPEHRHKLRILASSASLPAEQERSLEYLWDMFGSNGFETIHKKCDGLEAWKESIVPGQETKEFERTSSWHLVSRRPFEALLDHALEKAKKKNPSDPVPVSPIPDEDSVCVSLWEALADELRVPGANIAERIESSIRWVAARVAAVCFDEIEKRSRAATASRLVGGIFSDVATDEPYQRRLETLRALLFVRGGGDGMKDYFETHLGEKRDAIPSFRVHTFFRSIEGLYAPAWKELYEPPNGEPERTVEIGPLSIEREVRDEFELGGRNRAVRLLEVLYCEACGELFFGGMRPREQDLPGNIIDELLPHEPALDGLPDTAASQRFEELSYDQYAIFWPTEEDVRNPDGTRSKDHGSWQPARLEHDTGIVRRSTEDPRFGEVDAAPGVNGYLYYRDSKDDRHKRGRMDSGTHVPYSCPHCATDYYYRRREMGLLSPIRNFRAGFAKTTQLLASELHDVQRIATPNRPAKLVSFSDSRQDAARAALDIEKRHHQDMRRELLVIALHNYLAGKTTAEDLEARLEEEERARKKAGTEEDWDAVERHSANIQRLQADLSEASETSIPLSRVMEHWEDPHLSKDEPEVGWLIGEMARRGVHPTDDTGVRKLVGTGADQKVQPFEWDHLFAHHNGRTYWRQHDPSNPKESKESLHAARKVLVRKFQTVMTDVVFSKVYYALEETGLGYVTLAKQELPEERRSKERVEELAALVRVITDAYRYQPSPFRSGKDAPSPWVSWGDIKSTRVRNYAKAVWGPNAEKELMLALEDLRSAGHDHGVVELQKTRIQLADGGHPFWKCQTCTRVHLHRGSGVCTRCLSKLTNDESGVVEVLWQGNFLARRVRRALEHERGDYILPAPRLHCEELTGQTDDPARRQREFKGIFLKEDYEEYGRKASDLFEKRYEIDLMAVTTTMEVGIDIGPLQSILQANMPPQRFNYQQRVGRAGRRGQAFSMALTICRSRSHDLHYFKKPEAITGDIPPVPFLTKGMNAIAQRLLTKHWLAAAFSEIREEEREGGFFPGDLDGSPDIHGEFVRVERFLGGGNWSEKLLHALRSTKGEAEAFGAFMIEGGRLEEPLEIDAKNLVAAMETRLQEGTGVAKGLGHALAELGLLPMYGMPTRTRNLYLDFRRGNGIVENVTMDRDLDIAIYEFAPGHVVVKDKKEHVSVGFTPDLALPLHGPEPKRAITFPTDPFGERFQLARCPACGAWHRTPFDEIPSEFVCSACQSVVSEANSVACYVPNGFRTDFYPKVSIEEGRRSARHRSIQAEGDPLAPSPATLNISGRQVRLATQLDPLARTYRLNRGPIEDNMALGFDVMWGIQNLNRVGGNYDLPKQALDTATMDHLERQSGRGGGHLPGFNPTGESSNIWLAAPKTTDAIYLAPQEVLPGLALKRLPPRSEGEVANDTFRWQGVRASALSATFLIASRAALDLDIDPVELEVLEPRLIHGRRPVLQLTDELINGAGFCRFLHESVGGAPRIAGMIWSMLYDGDAEPRASLEAEDHRSCRASCYRCLLRYGNQQYHGLLDWRLGMAFLNAVADPDHSCGLDGDFSSPWLEGWPSEALDLANQATGRFGGSIEVLDGGVPAFELDLGGRRVWILVSHPLWDWEDERNEGRTSGVLAAARDQLQKGVASGMEIHCMDTFNLSRRLVKVRERIRMASA